MTEPPLPPPPPPDAEPPGSGGGAPQASPAVDPELRTVTVPILVSAIANLVGGYLWFTTCLGIVLTAPMFALCVFEFYYFAKAPQMSRAELDRRGSAIGIFELIVGLFNGVSLVCGILTLIALGKLKTRWNLEDAAS